MFDFFARRAPVALKGLWDWRRQLRVLQFDNLAPLAMIPNTEGNEVSNRPGTAPAEPACAYDVREREFDRALPEQPELRKPLPRHRDELARRPVLRCAPVSFQPRDLRSQKLKRQTLPDFRGQRGVDRR